MVNEYSKLCGLLAERGWLADPALQATLQAVAQAFSDEDIRQCAMGEFALALLSVGAAEPAREALSRVSLRLEKIYVFGACGSDGFQA